jgi:hypothetical protein
VDELNFTFTLYAFDRRPASQVKQLLEDRLGCVFAPEQSDRPASELVDCFEAEALGIYVSLQPASTWPEGFVYRVAGGTAAALFTPGGRRYSLAPHVTRLLQRAGIERVLSKEEFATENRERFPELYREAET